MYPSQVSIYFNDKVREYKNVQKQGVISKGHILGQ